MLKLTFLGTSSGVPTRSRNVTGLAVELGQGHGWFLFDCGEGTQQQLQRARLSLHALTAICISHVHGDHCYGLPGLLASMGMGGRKQPLMLVAPLPVRQWLEATRALTDLHLPYDVVHVDVTEQPCVFAQGEAGGDLRIERHVLQHRVPSHAYRLQQRTISRRLKAGALKAVALPRGPAWRALQQGEDVAWNGRTLRSADFVEQQVRTAAVVIGGDNADPALLHAACVGAQVLVHEATYTRAALDKVGPGPMHSCAHDVAAFAQAAGVPNLVLTHFSPRHQNVEGQAEMEAEARAVYDGKLFLARDLEVYALNRDGVLNLEVSPESQAPDSPDQKK